MARLTQTMRAAQDYSFEGMMYLSAWVHVEQYG